MKRCPQCEFIYEDDQTCCDMDGIDLVFDHASPSVVPPQKSAPSKRFRSRRSLLSLLAVILGVLVLAIAYASLERAFTVNSEPASLADTSANEAALQNQDQPVKPAVVEQVEEATKVASPGKAPIAESPSHKGTVKTYSKSEPLERNSLGTRGVILGSIPRQNRIDPSHPQPAMIRPKPEPAPAKKDSKVISIVKKTGRLVTKPFKL